MCRENLASLWAHCRSSWGNQCSNETVSTYVMETQALLLLFSPISPRCPARREVQGRSLTVNKHRVLKAASQPHSPVTQQLGDERATSCPSPGACAELVPTFFGQACICHGTIFVTFTFIKASWWALQEAGISGCHFKASTC